MEISIKTHDDFRRDHVTITLAGTSAEVRAIGERVTGHTPSRNLYTDDEVAALQAKEAELVAGPLRVRILELEAEVERNAKAADLVQSERIRGNNLARRVAELELALSKSIDRENKLEADAAEEAQIHSQSIVARDNLLAQATTRVKAAAGFLSTSQVQRARDEIVTSKGAVLADAIGNALRALEA